MLNSGSWDRIFESILNFNFANTDSDSVPDYMEAISLVSAYQRLLGTGSDVKELKKVFSRYFAPSRIIQRDDSSCTHLATLPNQALTSKPDIHAVREVWLDDFGKLRGNLAHGKLDSRYPSIWSIDDHLLLASYAFPLLLKLVLKQHGYSLTQSDQFDIDCFEQLACVKDFAGAGEDKLHPWIAIRHNAKLSQMAALDVE